jgi:hypothetical protein
MHLAHKAPGRVAALGRVEGAASVAHAIAPNSGCT